MTKSLATTIALSLLLTALAGGQPAPKAAPRATDLHGDPLPDGAMARLGTMRFRHGRQANAVAYAADGKVLVSAGSIGYAVCLWDASTGRPLHFIPCQGMSLSVAVSPDGKSVFTANLTLIDVATGKELNRFGPPPNSFLEVAFAPDGKTVAAADMWRGPITLWDVATGKERAKLAGKDEAGSVALAFSPDAKILVSVGEDSKVQIWDIASGNALHVLEADGRVAFAPHGKILAASHDDSIGLWDTSTWKKLREFRTDKNRVLDVAYSPDGKTLATSDTGDTIRLWDANTGKQIRRWPAPAVYRLAFSPDGKVLASTAVSDNAIHRWDPATGKEIAPIAGHTQPVNSLLFGPDSKSLISWAGQTILQWDITTGRERGRLFSEAVGFPKNGAFWRIAAHSPDGKIVARLKGFMKDYDYDKWDDAIHLWDTATNKEFRVIRDPSAGDSMIRFSRDGKILTSCAKHVLRRWETATGKDLGQVKGQFGGFKTFSPDEKLLACIEEDSAIRVLDTTTGKEIRRWPSEQRRVYKLVISPGGEWLASVDNATIRIWAVADGKQLLGLRNEDNATAVVFSPTGRLQAAAGREQRKVDNGDRLPVATIRIWEVLTGQPVRQMDSQQWQVSALVFSPDSRTLASGGGDSTILHWDLTNKAQRAKGKPGPLTAAELNALWNDLSGDAAKADKAIWALVDGAKQSLPLLQEKLRPAAPAPIDQVTKLITDLESAQFAVRQQAALALEKMGEAAETAVRKSLKGNSTLEVRQRLAQILDKRQGEVIRQLRAIEVLEHMGTPEARQVLEALAKGSPTPARGAGGGSSATASCLCVTPVRNAAT